MSAPLFLLLAALGCVPGPDKVVDNQVLDVACGPCIYRLPDGVGCYWAVELDGEHYPVAGELPKDHDNHGPVGMCNMKRQARITGELRGDNFIASSFELIDPTDVPTERKYDDSDVHDKNYKVGAPEPAHEDHEGHDH